MSTMTRNRYRWVAERRKTIIDQLRKELAAEKRMTNALSGMRFSQEQPLGAMIELKRSMAMKSKITGRKTA